MSFIVIEVFGGPECAIIVTDYEGNNCVFENREDAEAGTNECQAEFSN